MQDEPPPPPVPNPMKPHTISSARHAKRNQPPQRFQPLSFSANTSTARIISDGRVFNPRQSRKIVSTVGILRPRSISEMYPRSRPATSASFSCVIPASRLNRASVCPTTRFRSCCSSVKSKHGAYQERLRISSHYSTIVLVFVAPSQELAVDLLGVGGPAFWSVARQDAFQNKEQPAPSGGIHHGKTRSFIFPKHSSRHSGRKTASTCRVTPTSLRIS